MIGDIKSRDIQKLIDELANPKSSKTKPLALSGLQKVMLLLNACFKIAIQEGILFINPCDGVCMPKESCITIPSKKQVSLTDEEIQKFKVSALRVCKTTSEYPCRDGLILLIIINLGLRVGEALALNWNDIDFDKRIVRINKTLQRDIINFNAKQGENKLYNRIKNSTKTKAGERVLSLNSTVLSYLQELQEYDRRNNIISEYVCCTTKGTLHSRRNLQRSMERILENAGINHKITLHTLRHTFGSYLIRKGVRIEVVSKLMGHSRITITYNQYIHSIREEEAKAMNLIEVC